jgi:hypothetical protein
MLREKNLEVYGLINSGRLEDGGGGEELSAGAPGNLASGGNPAPLPEIFILARVPPGFSG